MILMLKAKQMFLKCFNDTTVKKFDDSLKIEIFLSFIFIVWIKFSHKTEKFLF